jgi:4-carboxymuconolactone decarboxylase
MALIPYADDDSADERVRKLVARLPDPRINLFTMLANAPALAGPTLRLGEAILTKSDLDYKLRELVILHAARLTGTEYEWVQHEQIARLVGVDEAQIRAIDSGRLDDGGFERADLIALRMVGELLVDGTPAPELVTEVATELGSAQLLELLLVAGYYAMLGGVMRAVQLDVDNVMEKGMLDRGRLSGER